MDSYKNPFSPGAGTQPPELAGRQEILDRAMLALARVRRGRPEKSLILVGLRGVGKTVLLNKFSDFAEDEDYKVIMVEADENKSLPLLLIPYLRQTLYSLDRLAKTGDQVKRGLRVLKSFISGLRLKVDDVEFSLDIDAEKGTADSGDLEADLTQLFIVLGEVARDADTALVLIIDEIQYLTEQELSSLIMAAHKIAQKSLPFFIMGAGLPQLLGKIGNAKSYAERLFDYPEIGPLSDEDAITALQEPMREEGEHFSKEALRKILQITEKYPYFLQQWGHQAWEIATKSPVGPEVIDRATEESIHDLDQNFFRVRFDRLTPREKEYLRAMAELGPGAHRSGDIADVLGTEVKSLAPFRSQLISKGMIYSPAYGDTKFTVPLFGQFMKRTMPNFQTRGKRQKLL